MQIIEGIFAQNRSILPGAVVKTCMTMSFSVTRYILVLILTFCVPLLSNAQLIKALNPKPDTNYVVDLTHQLTVRVYESRKFTRYVINDEDKDARYLPNDRYNLGIGANYKFLGINLGFNIPFINDDDDKYGRTEYLDLQSHLYTRKLNFDFWGQFYRGYYLKNTSSYYPERMDFIARGDLATDNIGINVQYIFNAKKYSFLAPFVQNEYQKKSAGSLLLGGSAYITSIRGDTLLIPENDNPGENFTSSRIYGFSVSAGYAYTVVIREHFFIMGGLLGGVGFNNTYLHNKFSEYTTKGNNWHLDRTIRLAAGYNSLEYFFGVSYIDFLNMDKSPISTISQEYGGGNVRINVVKRFKVKEGKKILGFM